MSPCPPPVVSHHRDGPRFHQKNFWEPPQAYFRDVRIEKYPAHDHPVVVNPVSIADYSGETVSTMTMKIEHHEAKTIGYAGFWYEE